MGGRGEPAHAVTLIQLHKLIALGRRYETFARTDPSQANAQIVELNAPGLQEHAWDLDWIPRMLRPKIARVSSILVLELCHSPGHPQHDPSLMDALMPAAIIAACLVAHTYGVFAEIRRGPLPGRLDTFARLLHRVTVERPDELEVLARSREQAVPSELATIAACLPTPVRDRLIGLAQIMAGPASRTRLQTMTVIFLVGAVAAETFERLSDAGARPAPPDP